MSDLSSSRRLPGECFSCQLAALHESKSIPLTAMHSLAASIWAILLGAELLDGPLASYVSDERAVLIQDGGSVHLPDRHVARCVLPQDVAHAVPVEIAGAGDAPMGRHVGDERAILVQHRGAVHLPDRHVAGCVL